MCYPFGHDGAGSLGSHPSQGARLQRKGGGFRVTGKCDTPATKSRLAAPEACREHKTLKSCHWASGCQNELLSKASAASCNFVSKGIQIGQFYHLAGKDEEIFCQEMCLIWVCFWGD